MRLPNFGGRICFKRCMKCGNSDENNLQTRDYMGEKSFPILNLVLFR